MTELKTLKKNEFRCASCNGIFIKGLTDEEAKEQYKKEFPNIPFESYAQELVCDDCYNKMNEIIPTKDLTEEDLK